MPTPVRLLLTLSRETLSLTQAELAALLGSSLRTVQRWEQGRGSPWAPELHKLADDVRPHDPDLAAQIDEWAPRPVAVPLPPRPSPPEPPPLPPPALAAPPPPPVPAVVLVDSVVCAAAEAMGQAPQAVRPAVLAAFVRARDAGLALDAVVAVLSPPTEKGKGGKVGGR